MAELRDIDKVINKIVARIPELATKATKVAAKDISNAVIDHMPIKTGKLANNWQAARTDSSSFDPQRRGDLSTAKKRINDEIDRLPPNTKNIYLNNPAPYGVPALARKGRTGAVYSAARTAQRKTVQKLAKQFGAEFSKAFK